VIPITAPHHIIYSGFHSKQHIAAVKQLSEIGHASLFFSKLHCQYSQSKHTDAHAFKLYSEKAILAQISIISIWFAILLKCILYIDLIVNLAKDVKSEIPANTERSL